MQLADDENRRLAFALGTTPDTPEFADRVQALGEIALEEVVDWVLAKRRFDSVSAIDRHRVLQIFGVIRKEAPTVEALSNQLGISESRAVSLLSRLRYGDAHTVRYLTLIAGLNDLEVQLEHAEEHGNRKHVWIRSETGRVVDEANTGIMLDAVARGPGGKYSGAEKAERAESTRTGQSWSASARMWDYIKAFITERAEMFAPPEG